MRKTKIHLCGLQRSGTNFVSSLSDETYEYNFPYWKHAMKLEGIDPDGCDKVLCVIKNPYTWVESVCFRDAVDLVPFYYEYNLDKFLPDFDTAEQFIGPFNLNIQRICDVYRLFYTSWMNYDKTELVHYEDLLDNDLIYHRVPQNHNWDANRISMYKNYDTQHLTSSQVQFISTYLGEDFFNRIGYPIK